MVTLLFLATLAGCTNLTNLLHPSPAPTVQLKAVDRPTMEGAVVYTRTPTLTSTFSPSPTPSAAPSPTITVTPSPTPTATINALACLPTNATTYGLVQWVSDGDTIVVDIDGTLYSVHYLGVDAPAYIPAIEYIGPVAMERNTELVTGRSVRLVKDVPDRDHFGELLRYVILDDGVFVNFELLIEGLGRLAPLSMELACDTIFRQAEEIARANQVGIWMATPTRPPTFTPIPTATRTWTPTATRTNTPTPTLSGSITPSATSVTSTVSPTPTSSTVTATSQTTPQATFTSSPTPTDSATPTSSLPDIHITDINYFGTAAENESDEYVEIKNFGQTTVSIYNWLLVEEDNGIEFIFPNFNLVAGQTCRIYTNEDHIETCGFNFKSPEPVWNNESDCAYLYDENDNEIDYYCYPQ
jgi:endonuclease YncB( thermonuclease family)